MTPWICSRMWTRCATSWPWPPPRGDRTRLRGRDPEFTVSAGMEDGAELSYPPLAVVAPESEDDGGTWRVTLRLPENLRAGVDAAARADGMSVNAWLVRAAAAALGSDSARRSRSASDKSYSGWV